MPSDPVSLRPADATLAEGEAFARHLDVAADGFFRILLGSKMAAIVAEAYLEPGHDLSHEHVTFAEHGGSIVGMASGFTADQHQESTDDPLTRAAGPFRSLRMAAISTLGRRVLDFIHTVPAGDFYLLAVAVDDDQRGLGVGSRLIDHMEQTARAAGCRRIVLDVAGDNEGARRLYERRGMTLEAESPRVFFAPGMSALRMVKPLA